MKNNRTFLEKLLDGAEVEWKPLMDLAEIGTGNSNRLIHYTNNHPQRSSETRYSLTRHPDKRPNA